MRGAFGKPQGTVARVHIGQVLISVRTRDNNKAVVIEALRRAKYKFPGRQKIVLSNKWGFTKLNREEYVTKRAEGLLQPDGCYVKYVLFIYYSSIIVNHLTNQIILINQLSNQTDTTPKKAPSKTTTNVSLLKFSQKLIVSSRIGIFLLELKRKEFG